MSEDSTPMREPARRVFAAELNDATFSFKESDDEMAPVYVLLPTGERANRVFVVGTLTETEDVGTEQEYWQGRVVDPTGTIFTYAGQYQPEAAGTLRELETPAYVAVVGKPRTYETDDGSINVALRPESITVVAEAVRDRWVLETADRTLDRIDVREEEGNEYGHRAAEEYGEAAVYVDRVIEALENLEETASIDA
ncbi:MAG: RPA family protein [Halodesulfurarchaeum sp.]